MANLLRLIALTLVCFGGSAIAALTPIKDADFQWKAVGGISSADPVAACASIVKPGYTFTGSVNTQAWNEMGCLMTVNASPGSGAGAFATVVASCEYLGAGWGLDLYSGRCTSSTPMCPVNASSTNGTCACNAGFVESGNSCVAAPPGSTCPAPNVMVGGKCLSAIAAYCAENAGSTDVSREVVTASNVAPASICVPTIYEGDKGCASTFERTFSAKGDDGKWYSRGTATLSATLCNIVDGAAGTDPDGTTPETAAPTAPKAECETGQPGTVNGTKVCLPYPTKNGVTTESNGVTTTTNPDGSKVEESKANSVTCNAAGACSITTVTTTTTTSASGTTSTSQSSSTQQTTKAAYCATAAGRADSACTGTVAPGGGSGAGDGNGDSSFSGTCLSDFQCSGDAVRCATARATWKTYCEASTLNDAAKTGLAAEMAKAGTDQSSKLDVRTVNLGSGGFDTSDALGGASCQIDKTVVVMGQSVVLPLSVVCPYLQYVGFALVSVAFIAGALIVFKS